MYGNVELSNAEKKGKIVHNIYFSQGPTRIYKIISTMEDELSKRTVEDLDSQSVTKLKRKLQL